MAQVVSFPLPVHGAVFADARGDGRVLRVSWHADEQVVVLSTWHGDRCTATVQVPAATVPDLLKALTDGPLGEHEAPHQALHQALQQAPPGDVAAR